MSKLLVVIDMQNDFIDGTLGTGEAVQIVDKAADKIKNYEQNGDMIIFTKDTHSDNYMDTLEGKNLPVKHCITNTSGWEISSKICNMTDISKYKIYEKVTFGSSELAKDLMNGVYDTVSQIELIGLCTDICVISNALLIKTFLPEIPVAVDASCCAGVTKESHKNALEAMKMCQINILNQ